MAPERFSVWGDGREIVSYSSFEHALKAARRASSDYRYVMVSDKVKRGVTVATFEKGERTK
jgi:hypothetical protein